MICTHRRDPSDGLCQSWLVGGRYDIVPDLSSRLLKTFRQSGKQFLRNGMIFGEGNEKKCPNEDIDSLIALSVNLPRYILEEVQG